MSELANNETHEPISASADGKRNMFTLQCAPTGQSMNYAACLWRQGVLANPSTKTPADWSPCNQARGACTCPALKMRQEEESAGRALYFEDRNIIRKITDTARRWFMPTTKLPTGISKRDPAVAGKYATGRSMLDAMGDAGSLADAITAAASEESKPAAPAAPVVMANAGESPLQLARRLAAQKSNQPT